MKSSDFRIGLEFTCGPFQWRCTDVGERTVTAIRLVEDNPVWYEGPPYMVDEVVLDEADLEDAHLSDKALILERLDRHSASGHPGYPHEVVSRMMKEGREGGYPRRRLMRFDRVRDDGEIVHPYAGHREGGNDDETWIIHLFLPFTKEWTKIREREFLTLPLSTPAAVRARADRK
jgi:hypothetical protein